MSHAKIKKYLKAQRKAREAVRLAERIISNGPPSFYHEKLDGYIEGLFSFSPFKDGDRVEIIEEIDCDNGWAVYKNSLAKGKTGIIQDVDYSDGKFGGYVKLDYPSYYSTMDKKEKKLPHEEGGLFWLSEYQIRRVRHDTRKKTP